MPWIELTSSLFEGIISIRPGLAVWPEIDEDTFEDMEEIDAKDHWK